MTAGEPDRYTAAQRAVQARFETVPLADRLTGTIVSDAVDDAFASFITSRDFLFLATVDASGSPTVSYKGGPPGFVELIDPRTLQFPLYDGNGMYLSAGNIAETARVGLLFIDFETPNRVRVQATASLSEDPAQLERCPGAQLAVRCEVEEVFVNCARYVHPHTRVGTSRYVPDGEGRAPYPSWKRIDFVQDVLRPVDRGRAADEGGIITFADYAEALAAGES